jgi:enediyne biosynthesis protein E4
MKERMHNAIFRANRFGVVLLLVTGVLFVECFNEPSDRRLFTLLSPEATGIVSSNIIQYTEEFNPYTFRNFFNGGGVAIGDINNDSLPDLYFCFNQQPNRLYLNKGNFQFEDITEKANVSSRGVWSTGVTMVDINGDGWIDIYVCKSGDLKGEKRNNELFINNGDLTFTEKSQEYNLDNTGLSTHAGFSDFDNDGDLDCYLLNNSFKSVGNYDLVKNQREIPDTLGGNKLLRNDNNRFTDVTSSAGIYSSNIGFGLGVTISDINKDGWQDIYVANDFFERDYLYINQRDGTFSEMLEHCISEISLNSMGADIADINNDSYPEIYVTDMFPQDEGRLKTKTNFETWNKYQSNIGNGYHKQFVRNTLQLNNGDATFSEIGRFSGTSATDWSWGALIADFDNDGHKDIFVANGIYKDITDQDYIQYAAGEEASIRKRIMNNEKSIITRLVDLIPSQPISNYAFSNNGNLTFVNKAKEWGLDLPGFSNGSAYGDLDNDGDLDLVVNNVNMPCFVYRNESMEQHPENKFLKVSLRGEGKNTFGIGAKVTVYYNGTLAYQEQMPMRGFESTVDNRLNFGLGRTAVVDSVKVQWADGKVNLLKSVQPNDHLIIDQRDGVRPTDRPAVVITPLFSGSSDHYGLDFVHDENDFVDFDRDRLIFHMLSTEGPRLAKGDVNNDGLEDVYIGGAKGQAGALYEQTKEGRFRRINTEVLEKDAISEDTDAAFFDADGDGDQDLYVCSGGNEFPSSSTALIDRLYLNDGKGLLTRSRQILPTSVFESTSCVRPCDYDRDGDVDLFVGVRLKPFMYGYPCKSYVLANNGEGQFTDVTGQVATGLLEAGMVTDAAWLDYDKDNMIDLVVSGEYMPVKIFHNEKGIFREVTAQAGLGASHGWWNRLHVADLNADGYPDIVAGNHGLNSRFRASESKPVTMHAGDFDSNGSIEQIISCYNGEQSYPLVLKHDLVSAIPSLKKKYLKYESYMGQRVNDIFSPDELKHIVVSHAYRLESSVLINNRTGGFNITPLPAAAQFSPVYGIAVEDFDADGKTDILLGGNFYQSKPEVGIYDASYGLLLKGDGSGGFYPVNSSISGIHLRGQMRDIMMIRSRDKRLILCSINNAPLKVLSHSDFKEKKLLAEQHP